MTTQFLELAHGRLAFDDRGTGRLVICVPSMGDVRQEYRFLAPMLVEAGYRVVTMDVRGHGESSVNWPDYSVAAIGADILALIRHLNAKPTLLVGNSMAGGASVWAAAEAPELIAGVALIDPVLFLVATALHAPVQMIEGAGHYPHAEMPEQVAPLLISFFQQLPPDISFVSK